MTTQDQYANTIRQSQEAWTGVVESLTENLQNVFGQSAKSFGTTDPSAAIDQVFDFWKQTIEAQRQIAKQLVSAAVSTSETVRSQAESVGTAIREQVESASTAVREQAEAANTAVREQAESFSQAAREQAEAAERAAREQAQAQEQAAHDEAAKKYESLTKDALQEELERRDLPKTGNVGELRERLIEDDQK